MLHAEIAERAAWVNGMALSYLDAGAGPLVVLLHGFPDSADTWRYQIPALVAAGFRVVAPTLRGYGRSSKPRGLPAYDIGPLTEDVRALIAILGSDRVTALAGHDWGGAIAWRFAAQHPELLERLVVLNAPHPAAFARELRSIRQLMRSWYVAFFQLPWIPEQLLSLGDFRLLRQALSRNVLRAGAFSEEDWLRVRTAIAEPGALTAAVNYYRAAARRLLRHRGRPVGALPPVETPTLLLWGERDPFLGVGMTEQLDRWISSLSVLRLPHAGHWVHWDAPDTVTATMLAFIRRPAPAADRSSQARLAP